MLSIYLVKRKEDVSKSREQLINYLKQIDITDKVVLDAGCGPKDKWARNFTKGEPKEYVTLDVDKRFNPDIVYDLNEELNYDWVDEFLEEQGNKYDIVFCIETLEHLIKPLEAVERLWQCLKLGGKAYFSTPLINPYHDEVDYARYTSEWYEKVLTQVGFKNIKIKPRVATDGLPHLLNFYKAEGLRLSKIRRGQEETLAHIGYWVECQK